MQQSRSNRHLDHNLLSQKELAKQVTEKDLDAGGTPVASSSFSMNERAEEEFTDSDYKKKVLADALSRPSSNLPSVPQLRGKRTTSVVTQPTG